MGDGTKKYIEYYDQLVPGTIYISPKHNNVYYRFIGRTWNTTLKFEWRGNKKKEWTEYIYPLLKIHELELFECPPIFLTYVDAIIHDQG